MHCPCGAEAFEIEGMVTQGPRGERIQACRCTAGHSFGVTPVKLHECPRCRYQWQEAARGGAPEIPVAAPEQVTNMGDLGFDQPMRY